MSAKISNSEKLLGFIVLIVVSSCIGAMVLAVGFTGRANLAKAERASCARVISDRLSAIAVREVQAKTARILADDVTQSIKTRNARREEALQLEVSITDLRIRVDPDHGGQLICSEAFPNPRIF